MGNRKENLDLAMYLIKKNIGSILIESSVFETEPWGYSDIEYYYNLVLKINTKLGIKDLLNQCLSIESLMGRSRTKPSYGPRNMDIDILFYDRLVLNGEGLIIPHPRLHLRNFVLFPLEEIDGELLHPLLNKKVYELLKECKDSCMIKKIPFPKNEKGF